MKKQILRRASAKLFSVAIAASATFPSSGQLVNNAIWPDDKGVHVNAHGLAD